MVRLSLGVGLIAVLHVIWIHGYMDTCIYFGGLHQGLQKYMDILWRVTPRFTEVHGYTLEAYTKVYRSTWIYTGGLQQGLQKYMDIHWRLTTRFTEVHEYTLEGYNKVYRSTWIYIGGLQQGLQT